MNTHKQFFFVFKNLKRIRWVFLKTWTKISRILDKKQVFLYRFFVIPLTFVWPLSVKTKGLIRILQTNLNPYCSRSPTLHFTRVLMQVVSSISILFVVVSTVGMTLNTMQYFQHEVLTCTAVIEEGFIQKRRQRSSLLFGGRQNLFNSLSR